MEQSCSMTPHNLKLQCMITCKPLSIRQTYGHLLPQLHPVFFAFVVLNMGWLVVLQLWNVLDLETCNHIVEVCFTSQTPASGKVSQANRGNWRKALFGFTNNDVIKPPSTVHQSQSATPQANNRIIKAPPDSQVFANKTTTDQQADIAAETAIEDDDVTNYLYCPAAMAAANGEKVSDFMVFECHANLHCLSILSVAVKDTDMVDSGANTHMLGRIF